MRILRQAIITCGLEVICRMNPGAMFPTLGGRGVIFTLHHVRPYLARNFNPNAHLEVTPDFLKDVIVECLNAGLTPAHVDDLPELLADPDDKRRFVAFTLDDGYRNNRDYAAPLFREYNIPYTIFITPGFVRRSASMWWSTLEFLLNRYERIEIDLGQGTESVDVSGGKEKIKLFNTLARQVLVTDQVDAIRRLHNAAARVLLDPISLTESETMDESELQAFAESEPLLRYGGHSMTHSVFSQLTIEGVKEEVTSSIDHVVRYAGRHPRAFAYPYGTPSAVSSREFAILESLGIKMALTTQPSVISRKTMERPTAIGRVSLNGLYQKRRYIKALISGVPFMLSR